MSQKQVVTRPGGSLKVLATTGTINSVILPSVAGKVRKPLLIQADVICSATVGNRILQARIYESVGGVQWWMGPSSTAVTAGQTGGYDIASPIGPVNTTVRRNIANTANTNVQVNTTLPEIWLYIHPNGASPGVYINDITGVDAADVVTYRIWYMEYEA